VRTSKSISYSVYFDSTPELLPDHETEILVDSLLQSKKIFAAGAGRSGLMAKSFVMRLMHMGFDAYVVGETVTPNLQNGDLFIIGSGSGETKSMTGMAEKAKGIGGTLAVCTIAPHSTLGRLADIVIKIPGLLKETTDSNRTIQPMGSLFEQTLLLFFDAVILRLMEKKSLDSDRMYLRHANLE
jgi:6-phospho-3-hexuloisomerase